jgi:hypothetical protein
MSHHHVVKLEIVILIAKVRVFLINQILIYLKRIKQFLKL